MRRPCLTSPISEAMASTRDHHRQTTMDHSPFETAGPAGAGPVKVVAPAAATLPDLAAPHPARPTSSPRRRDWGRLAGLAAGLLALAAVAWWGWPRVAEWLTTVSTDDAYVDSHVTIVAPRVAGQVTRVLVDDNARVKKGDLLVELDREPYQEQVELKRAGVETAEAELGAAESRVRGDLALARAQRWKLQTAIEGVKNQVADLRARVAA